jgi:hypothetical protein
MIFRSLDANHDWGFGHGSSNYSTGDAAIGLNIETKLLSWVNDCFFDMTAGVDWLTRLGNKNQRALLEADVKRIIQSSFGVTGINSFAMVVNGRTFSISADIQTINSPSYKLSISQNQQVANA